MYEVVSGLLEVFSAVFQGYCLQYFFGSFLEIRIRNRRIGVLAVTALYGILRLGMGFFLPKGYTSFWVFARLAVILCIVSVTALVFYRAVGKITLFLIVTFMAVGEMSVFLAHIFFELVSHLFRLWGWCLENGYISPLEFYNLAINIIAIGNQILFHIIGAVLLYFTMRKIVSDYREKDYAVHRTELLFILTPGLTGLMVCTLLRITIDTAENGVPEMLYDRYPSLMVIMPVILLLLLFSVMFGIKLFQDMICWNREKSSRIILENQVGSLQEHMREMERVYSGIRGMKHDMKNTLSVIMQLAGGKEKELQAYLEELNQTMDRLEFRFKTGNTVVDTLLNMKYHEIIRTVPDLQMDVEGLQFPEKLFIQSYDIGIILGNALDNAMEACRKLKAKEPAAEAFIRISSFQKRELFFLKVENSFDGRVVRKPQNEFPVTDKADRENHGIGLANIKSTAEKYQGTMDFKVKGRVFILSVMMKNEGEKKMDFGVTGKLGGYYLGQQYQKNGAAGKSESMSFAELAAAKAVEKGTAAGMSFKDMWQARFPGAYYHVMDGSRISQGAWDRNDFPFERFFSDNVDESILNWTPTGAEPSANSPEVQSRWGSTAGKKAIIVPPALEEKMQNNPELAEKVMANVENFIATYPATPGCSYLIELDENGEISKYRVTSPGTITVSSSEFVEARRAREAKHAEYERLAEESALKRKMLAQEVDRKYYQNKAVSIAAYEAAGILK